MGRGNGSTRHHWVYHDAQVSSEYLPGWSRNANKELRALFTGKPEHVVNLFHFLAKELREVMAELGFRTVNEMVGQTDRLEIRSLDQHWKYEHLNLSALLHKEAMSLDTPLYKQEEQDHGIDQVMDRELIKIAKPALTKQNLLKIRLRSLTRIAPQAQCCRTKYRKSS